MEYLNWTWVTSEGIQVPSVYEIIKFAEEQLWNLIHKCYNTRQELTIRCGGFETNICWKDDECYLSLKFVVEDWSESLIIKDNEI